MEKKEKKKIIAGAAILSGVGLAALLWKKGREEGVPPPPAEGYGRIWGYIKNSQTDERVGGAIVYLDGVQEDITDKNGMYGTDYVPFGPHTLVVEADNYERLAETIVISEESAKVEIRMAPLSEAPTEWTEGVEVVKIKVEPTYAYVGEGIEIKVYIQYPDPLPLPADIHGSVLVNGTLVSGVWTIDYRNPNLRLEYVAASPGIFTVRAQDKSAIFQVESAPTGTYYPPWGGIRMPICTEIVIPDVNPFKILYIDHPGGDLVYSGSSLTIPSLILRAIRAAGSENQLYEAYPTKWNPAGAEVTEYARHVTIGWRDAEIMIMATNYTCQEYWGSLNELADMIAEGLGQGRMSIPPEWVEEYSSTCPVCGGAGKVQVGSKLLKCSTCGGTGKAFLIDLRRGWRDWVKEIKFNSICGGGMCTPRLYCPYADEHAGGKDYVEGAPHTIALAWDVVSFVRQFLRHIENKHPNHPLTEQAWV